MIACILYNYYSLLMLSNWNYRYDWNKWIKRNAFVIYLCANSFNLILRDYNILSKTIYKHHPLALNELLGLGVFCCVFYTHTIQCRGLRAAIKKLISNTLISVRLRHEKQFRSVFLQLKKIQIDNYHPKNEPNRIKTWTNDHHIIKTERF